MSSFTPSTGSLSIKPKDKMDNWLRPVFARKQTPITSTDCFASFSTDDNSEAQEAMSRLRPTSRVSSQVGFRPSSPPASAADTFPNIRIPDKVYYNPSSNQMVEILKVVMMNQSAVDPVPVHYNSCILHVLEAYHDLQIQLHTIEDAMESLKQRHTRDIQEFEEMASGWHTKERDYQAEVKRLEVLLSKTEGGMESVSIARSDSLVHGSKRASDTISRGIGTIKERNAYPCRGDTDSITSRRATGVTPTLDGAQLARPLSQPKSNSGSGTSASLQDFQGRADRKRATITAHTSSGYSHISDRSTQFALFPIPKDAPQEGFGTPRLNMMQPEGLAVREQQLGNTFGSSTASSIVSSYLSMNEGLAPKNIGQGLGLRLHDKPLPDIPLKAADRARQVTIDRSLPTEDGSSTSLVGPRQMRFSYQPGDDADILSPKIVGHRAKRQTLDEQLERTSPSGSASRSRELLNSNTCEPKYPPQQSKSISAKSNSKPKPPSTGNLPYIPKDIQGNHSLSRGDSASSVITAIRHNSDHSSANGSLNNKETGRRRFNQSSSNNSSNDAIAAAARALASTRSPSRQSGLDSESYEENRVDARAQASKATLNTNTSSNSATSNVDGRSAGHQEG